jgi:serine/threonine protein phosphatase 1
LASFLDRLVSKRPEADPRPAPPRLTAESRPALIYAIGDIHGCLNELRDLERQIVADAEGVAGEKWVVTLGDYVDRGPASAQVIDHVLAPPPAGFRRICIAGNHEVGMLDALDDPERIDRWLNFGGVETMRSYGLTAPLPRKGRDWAQSIAALVPQEHVTFLRGLAVSLTVPGFVFVHAGVRPGVPMELQAAIDLQWIRNDFLRADFDFGRTVVHGHTVMREPHVSTRRISIDTGCFMSGTLTAVRIDAGGEVRILQTQSGPPRREY